MTQSSILNVKEGLVSSKRVQSIISMLTTTSTSYLLLASLDTARRRLSIEGREIIDRTIKLAQWIRGQVNDIEHLYCPGEDLLGTNATYDFDPTKVLISIKDLNITGYEVEKWLREKYNIEVELSDLYNILCIITPGDTQKEATILVQALRELSKEFHHLAEKVHAEVMLPDIGLLGGRPGDAF